MIGEKGGDLCRRVELEVGGSRSREGMAVIGGRVMLECNMWSLVSSHQ